MLQTTTTLAELYLRKESLAEETIQLIEERATLGKERTRLTADIQKVNTAIRKLEEKIHKSELGAGDLRHERTSLANKMREDYRSNLPDLHEQELTDEQIERRDALEKEINECRQRIALLGNVNLDALNGSKSWTNDIKPFPGSLKI